MLTAEIEQRLADLEKAFEDFKARFAAQSAPTRPWWIEQAGRFANNPTYDEIIRLGAEYRQSLRPDGEGQEHDSP